MKSADAPPPVLSSLLPDDETPLYRQIYDRFRLGIAQGLLKPGERVPSARALAKELGVARGTVELAYSLLGSEGYVQPRGQAGTVVAPALHPEALAPTPRQAAAQAPVPDLGDPDWPVPATVLPFQMGLPALDVFPRKLWARLGARQLRAMQMQDLAYPPLGGLPALRQAIAAHLQVARGIPCTPDQVFITSGYRGSLRVAIQALLAPGQRVWVEDPGYPPTRAMLAEQGLRAVPVPVDGEGLRVDRGVEIDDQAHAAVVTPAHHSPLSVALSLPRRQALLEWAQARGAWVVEDDYDGEYRYASRPLPALKSLDAQGRVLYAGTFSKVLFPGLRLAYLVVPAAQVARVAAVHRHCEDGAPGYTQALLAAFMAEGHFARHIQRMRRLYAQRRELAAQGLMDVLGGRMTLAPQPGGMHLLLRMPGTQSDQALAARMLANGLYAQPLSRWSNAPDAASGLLLGFTNIATRPQASALGRRILALL